MKYEHHPSQLIVVEECTANAKCAQRTLRKSFKADSASVSRQRPIYNIIEKEGLEIRKMTTPKQSTITKWEVSAHANRSRYSDHYFMSS